VRTESQMSSLSRVVLVVLVSRYKPERGRQVLLPPTPARLSERVYMCAHAHAPRKSQSVVAGLVSGHPMLSNHVETVPPWG
jgi:hypothetical protein